MKNKKYHPVGAVPKSNRKTVETEAKSISLTYISTPRLGTDTSMKSAGVKN